jgi:hypothetical protein
MLKFLNNQGLYFNEAFYNSKSGAWIKVFLDGDEIFSLSPQ